MKKLECKSLRYFRLIAIASIMFFIAFFPLTTKAADQTADLSGLTTAAAVKTAIQNAIIAAESSGVVTVTGATTGNITTDVNIDIPADVTMLWKANIRLLNNGFLILNGDGCFELTTDGEINQRIEAAGTNTAIRISGGSVGGIVLSGDNTTVTVNGGTVSSSSSYRSITAEGLNSIVTICGDGKVRSGIYAVNLVEVKDNAVVSITGSNTAIYGGENSSIFISGGTVSSVSGSSITNNGANCKVTVSGGIVTTNSGRAIAINDASSASTVTICGDAKIQKTTTTNIGEAIYTAGKVELKDDAEISVSGGTGISAGTVTVSGGSINAAYRAINSSATDAVITISGGTVKGNTGDAIYCYGTNSKIIVSGNAKVQGSFYGDAIWTNGSVEVKDKAEIISTSSRAISANGANSRVTVSGGLVRATTGYAICVTKPNGKIIIDGGAVFAYEPTIGVDNEDSFTGVSGTGVIIAWNQKAGNTSYVKGTEDDLSFLPFGCAKWDVVLGENGISYENGTNKGFIRIDAVSVTEESGIIPTQIEALYAYPNPGIDYISISGLQVNEMLYFYNLSGMQLFSFKATSNTERIAIDHLPAGSYFIKTSDGKTLKWIKK